MTKFVRRQVFDVFRPVLGGEVHIDTIVYQEAPKVTSAEVKRSLINHDNYPMDIIVRKGK